MSALKLSITSAVAATLVGAIALSVAQTTPTDSSTSPAAQTPAPSTTQAPQTPAPTAPATPAADSNTSTPPASSGTSTMPSGSSADKPMAEPSAKPDRN